MTKTTGIMPLKSAARVRACREDTSAYDRPVERCRIQPVFRVANLGDIAKVPDLTASEMVSPHGPLRFSRDPKTLQYSVPAVGVWRR